MSTGNRLVGVIGGMGPDATVDFMAKVIEKTPASSDQDHVRMLVEHNPRIPSRQLAMRGEGEDPGPVIAQMAARLEASGADFIVMPCNAAHAWQDDIVAATSIPFISIIDICVEALAGLGAKRIGVMAARGCLDARLYQVIPMSLPGA